MSNPSVKCGVKLKGLLSQERARLEKQWIDAEEEDDLSKCFVSNRSEYGGLIHVSRFMNLLIGISLGDITGIGPEVTSIARAEIQSDETAS